MKMSNEQTNITLTGETGEVQVPLSSDDLIITDTAVYKIGLLVDVLANPSSIEEGVAYIDNDIFYVYRGDYLKDFSDKPGIYKDGSSLKIVHPRDEIERKEMEYSDKVVVSDVMAVAAMINEGLDEIEYDNSNGGKIFAPPIGMHDDMLKRAIKMALLIKQVNIDERRDRFPDKNALFNAKQRLRGDQSVSWMLFIRWLEALGLECDIVLREANADKPIGAPLENDLVVSSTDIV